MNRALRAATMGVLLLSPVALSACSAGQVTQTAEQERDKVGAMAQVGDITLRAATLAYPDGGLYERGDDADLELAIVNSGQEADTLVGISGEGFGDVEIDDDTSGASASASDEIEIPSDSTVFVDSDDLTVTLADLDEDLTTGQYLDLLLTFEDAGEVELTVTVATPDEALEREEGFDFEHSEEGAEQEAREAESREGQ